MHSKAAIAMLGLGGIRSGICSSSVDLINGTDVSTARLRASGAKAIIGSFSSYS